MDKKQVAIAIGALAVVWHVASVISDAERSKANWNRWRAVPSTANLIRLIAAEGILIKDIGWLL